MLVLICPLLLHCNNCFLLFILTILVTVFFSEPNAPFNVQSSNNMLSVVPWYCLDVYVLACPLWQVLPERSICIVCSLFMLLWNRTNVYCLCGGEVYLCDQAVSGCCIFHCVPKRVHTQENVYDNLHGKHVMMWVNQLRMFVDVKLPVDTDIDRRCFWSILYCLLMYTYCPFRINLYSIVCAW